MIAETAIALGTLLLGLLTCRVALGLVVRLGMVDVPNRRSSHVGETPRGGGIGILLALAPGATAAYVLLRPHGVGGAAAAAVCGAVGLVFVLGLLDDRRGAAPAVKMVLQFGAALLVVLFVGRIRVVALPGGVLLDLGILAGPLTVFWLVGFSNGFNFMDGVDGIAGLHAGVAAGLMGVAGTLAGAPEVRWLALPLCGATLAFLSLNWSPARVFMGDAGSLPVGFLLALLAVLGNGAGVPFVSSFLILGPFLFDTIYTLFRRLLMGENVLEAHRSHLYQRLVITGLGHRAVSAMYGSWTLLAGLLGILYLSGGSRTRASCIVGGLVTGLVIVAYVRRRESMKADDGG